MSDRKLAVVGGGQMGRALVGGMLANQVIPPEQVGLVEPSDAGQAWWRENQPGVTIGELASVVPECDLVLLAVKPNVIAAVAKQKGRFWQGKLVVSIAAGVSLDQLSSLIGHKRVVRVMPNTPSLVAAGASAFCCGSDVTDEDKQWIQSMLDSVGLAVQVSEDQMDAVTGLSGSGPAYVCMVIEAMADGGVQAGLPRALAMQLATQTVLGTAKMIAETGRHPGELKDAVASPGGTTIAAIATLEQNGLRGAMIEAVVTSANRSRQMGESR
ncbi:MAG: pyrroline-5-carboxylate reductase [Rubripirellula sp.]